MKEGYVGNGGAKERERTALEVRWSEREQQRRCERAKEFGSAKGEWTGVGVGARARRKGVMRGSKK